MISSIMIGYQLSLSQDTAHTSGIYSCIHTVRDYCTYSSMNKVGKRHARCGKRLRQVPQATMQPTILLFRPHAAQCAHTRHSSSAAAVCLYSLRTMVCGMYACRTKYGINQPYSVCSTGCANNSCTVVFELGRRPGASVLANG